MSAEKAEAPRRGARGHRWDYMSAPGYNPPNLKCHEAQGAGRDRERCSAESKAYFIGGKSYFDEDGTRISQERWRCEHGHQWLYLTRETPVQQEPKEKT